MAAGQASGDSWPWTGQGLVGASSARTPPSSEGYRQPPAPGTRQSEGVLFEILRKPFMLNKGKIPNLSDSHVQISSPTS